MLDFTRHQDKPFLRLLLLHDDADREFDYTTGADQALERADANAWTVISIKHDWATVFPAWLPALPGARIVVGGVQTDGVVNSP